MKIGVALYGNNGHQIQYLLENNPKVELVAAACVEESLLNHIRERNPKVCSYDTLQEILDNSKVEIVSLCSPCRKDQAQEAVLCMKAGKHVYAEKPCALKEEELDMIINTAYTTGCKFHEMAGTAFDQPYLAMSKIIEEGKIGEVIQVFAQKSYPYFDKRPQNENIDGGLICHAGVHALRFIEHVAKQKVRDILAVETQLGNPEPEGGLYMAASLIMQLENGGVASAVINYLNQEGFGRWFWISGCCSLYHG